MNKEKLKWFGELFKESYTELKQNDPLRLSSSTAFFATFSVIPIITLILDFASTLFPVRVLKEEIFKSLLRILGESTTEHLSNILANVQNMQQGVLVTIGTIIFLAFIATTLFDVVHNSFNQILQIKLKDTTNLIFYLINRGLFMGIIILGGILFFSTFLVDVIIGFIGDNIFRSSNINPILVRLIDVIFSAGLFSIWIAIVYRYLPDVRLPWKPVWFGTCFTVLFFLIGQFILSQIVLMGNINAIYGASASMVLLLLLIFYSSFILFYGFCLVKKYAEKEGYQIKSTKFTVRYEINELG